MKKLLFILIFCVCWVVANAQSDSTKTQQVELNDIYKVEIDPTGDHSMKVRKRDYTPLKSIVFNVGCGIPVISNNLLNSDIWNKNTGFGFQFTADFRKQFTKEKIINNKVIDAPTALAMGIGLGLSYYNKSAELGSFSEKINGITDADGDICNVSLSCQNIKEKLSLLYLDIPLYLEIGKPSKTKFRAWGKVGVKGSILLSNNFEGSGQYTSTGYYPDKDVTLHDIPALGYYTNHACYDNPGYELNTFVLWSSLSAGVSIPLSNSDKDILRNVILKAGIKWDFSLMPISKSSGDSQFAGSKYLINQSNMLGGDGSRMHYVGLELSLIWSL